MLKSGLSQFKQQKKQQNYLEVTKPFSRSKNPKDDALQIQKGTVLSPILDLPSQPTVLDTPGPFTPTNKTPTDGLAISEHDFQQQVKNQKQQSECSFDQIDKAHVRHKSAAKVTGEV